MRWLEVSARVDADTVDAATELLARYAYGSVVVEEMATGKPSDAAIVSPALRVKAYLPDDPSLEGKVRELDEAWWHLRQIRRLGNLRRRMLEEKDWANAWKRHFRVHRIGAHIVIKPSWRAHKPKREDVVIELDPGAAFGTGLHPTTQLCLEELERSDLAGARVLDLGTGSGILAIAAAKLGAGDVRAIDTDPIAVGVAADNVRVNGVSSVVRVGEGSLGSAPSPDAGSLAGTCDLAIANIIADVIIRLAGDLAAALKPGGKLITGGIIEHRAEDVVRALVEAGFDRLERWERGDWVSIVAYKP